MAKRARGANTLTGGTGDVNPQYLNGTITLTAANTFTQVSQSTPKVMIGPASGNKAIIMEILKVFCDLPNTFNPVAGVTAQAATLSFTTRANVTAPAAISDPACFAFFERTSVNSFTAAGSGTYEVTGAPHIWDCTDAAGHGILVATDNIFIGATTANSTTAGLFGYKIMYRFKEVSLTEYIGIVQSQQ